MRHAGNIEVAGYSAVRREFDCYGRRDDARNTFKAREQLANKARLRGGIAVSGGGKIELRLEQMVGAETEINLLLGEKATHQQASRAEEQKRQRNLSGDHEIAHTALAKGGIATAGAQDRFAMVATGSNQSGRETKEKGGQDSD